LGAVVFLEVEVLLAGFAERAPLFFSVLLAMLASWLV
jgi:hypothetical protein